MENNWKFSCFGVLVFFYLYQNLIPCCSLNEEGLVLLKFKQGVVSDPYGALKNWKADDEVIDPCSWFGVECSCGKVVALNLKDLCLGGTLSPELRNLVNIKSIVLHNNSFNGIIPEGFGDLKELEVLDLGYNNFSGSLPPDLGSNLSLAILLLDNNELLSSLSLELHQLKMLSEFQVDENELSNTGNVAQNENAANRRQLEESIPLPQPSSPFYRYLFPSPTPPSSVEMPPMTPPVNVSPATPNKPNVTSPPVNRSTPVSEPTPSSVVPIIPAKRSSSNRQIRIILGAVGGTLFLLFSIFGIYIYKTTKTTVKPWATGLSGKLQKAFVIGVPKLKRSELDAACEDFSNVIGTSPIGVLYKGTLSSGVEIAVASVAVISAKDWSRNLEVQFRKKIETLSKVNHKNFINLLGYCEEEEPFTRMMVFEYAPNGTLVEHLHSGRAVKDSEHLNWSVRLRIAMGMAYCLDHMHQQIPPIAHSNLNSSSVFLTEDYAAKISDFCFTNMIEATRKNFLDVPFANPESNVYSYGVILLEMFTGRLSNSVDTGSLQHWVSDYLRGDRPLKEMVDPTLESFEEDKLERIIEVIKSCLQLDPKQRPKMREVTARLREITSLTPDAAIPKLSPLWWAELDILSADGG